MMGSDISTYYEAGTYITPSPTLAFAGFSEDLAILCVEQIFSKLVWQGHGLCEWWFTCWYWLYRDTVRLQMIRYAQLRSIYGRLTFAPVRSATNSRFGESRRSASKAFCSMRPLISDSSLSSCEALYAGQALLAYMDTTWLASDSPK